MPLLTAALIAVSCFSLAWRQAPAALRAASRLAWSPTFFANAAGFAFALVAVLGFALAVVLRAGVLEVFAVAIVLLLLFGWPLAANSLETKWPKTTTQGGELPTLS